MLITIRVDALGPPSGDVVVDDEASRPFAGWLELLGILAHVLPPPTAPGPPRDPGWSAGAAQGLGGQLDPRREIELGQDV
ncbi:MAG: hypothetical protein ACRD0C_09900 [Acidimicrobiia bacterium]